MVTAIASPMGKFLSKPGGSLAAGALHGLLPCGMVYMAIAASMSAGSAVQGSKFMLIFGLGTTPLLLLASAGSMFIKKLRVPALVTPALFTVAGAFLMIRGFNLDVPYIATRVIKDVAAICR
jgi:uncharacterized protein